MSGARRPVGEAAGAPGAADAPDAADAADAADAPTRRPRIAPVAAPDAEQAAALAKALPRTDGSPLNVFATLAHAPRLLRRVNALGGYFAVHGRISPRDRELVVLRVAGRTGSAYEAAHHRAIGASAGLVPAEVEAALDGDSAHPWAPADAALLHATDELVLRRTVGDATWTRLRATRDEHELLELLVLAGFYALLAGVIDAAGIELDPLPPRTG
ncbi:carboxymuconolactone decarboxylase family protein [Conexibacter sp. JD483]|uniref:carboxymuconolactone decarboxylase family protein n=1 Tax=unclassified Conexibacter TaxID=2627773 RepID=UPI002723D929|nr:MULTISPECIES: carboxymuconolactone decarboxylase family protein [unclassified Conexibacter]MDO8187812.1 carboxymuconolactone decarboxylase family protein [Conexibacter sp. CPCC 205706]MDO8199979.1 carboxymuconolactone decarboxylase family protein [Conexibacter sp. CPCC 205762]MDR9369506.1 carboxymuconolactone decarboxylase family protein [Conexibacter sp. JD483]